MGLYVCRPLSAVSLFVCGSMCRVFVRVGGSVYVCETACLCPCLCVGCGVGAMGGVGSLATCACV